MGDVPGGRNGAPEPRRDMTQGKPQIISGEPPRADWRRYARISLWVILALIVAIFLGTNSEPVPVNFVFFKTQAPLWLILLGVLIVGMILGWTGSWWWRRRKVRKG